MTQILITENNFDKARQEIKKNSSEEIIFSSNDDELNRKILEKENISMLLINQTERKDKLKQRNSGFNHVLAKIAKKNNIKIGINLDEIIKPHPRVYPEKSLPDIFTKGKQKSEILARTKQNIKICNKNKLKMKFISFEQKRNIYDLKALGLILGMPTWMIKEL